MTEKSEHSEIVSRLRDFVNSGGTRSYEFRLDQLRRVKSLLTNEHERICEAAFKDTRRRPELTDFFECSLSHQEVDYYIDNLKDWMKPEHVQKTMLTLLDKPYIHREPHGVVLLIAPFNFPITLMILPLIPILAAGNTVVVKPSEYTPNVSDLFEELFHKYFDEKVLKVIQGDGPATAGLLENRFDFICYTGSTHVGKLVAQAAAKHLTPTLLELGGQNPVIIDDSADLNVTAKRLIWARMSNCGQICLAPNHVITTAAVKEKLVPLLKKTLTEFYGEDAQKSADFMRIINTRHFDRIHGLVKRSKGKVVAQQGDFQREDLFLPPLVVEVEEDDALLEEELFGPVLPILTVDHIDDAFRAAKAHEKPLAAYIYSTNEAHIQRLIHEIPAGNVGVNDSTLNFAVDTLPFGGAGHSGMGRYRGRSGFDTFSNPKGVLHKGFFLDDLAAFRYPPLTPEKYQKMKSMAKRVVFPEWVSRLLYRATWFLLGVGTSLLYIKYFGKP